MGLLDYYKQFTALSPQEINEQLREQADERKRAALARVEPIDLSVTTWHELPHPNVVAAITYAARRGMNTYADRRATALRGELAHGLGVEPERVVVGTGAAQLLQAAAHELLEPGDELITPWPSYGLYPVMARRAHANAVPVPGFSVEAILSAVNDRTRVVCVCNPNDPTGELLNAGELRGLLDALPERVVVLLDEALADFADPAYGDASLELLADHPRVLVFRTFSKAWGLAGLRCGYAVGGPGAEPLLEQLAPDVAVNVLTQAGAVEALRSEAPRVIARVEAVAAERVRLIGALRERDIDVLPSQANVLWLAVPEHDGADVADRLGKTGVIVASGGPLGDADRVRVTIRNPQATDRLLRSLDQALSLLAAAVAALALLAAPPAQAVFAGTPAPAGTAPWMVGLSVGCGGSLIAPDRVLTAAHCVQDLAWEDLRVRVGAEHARGRLYDGVAAGVADVATHPLYRRGPSSGHDVALIRLTRPMTGRPLLALQDDTSTRAGAEATVIGFGASRETRTGVGFPIALRQGGLRVLSDRACSNEYRNSYESDTMICARDRDGQQPTTSPCVGDSGGPLLLTGADGVPRQAGVVSFGRVCGLNGEPSVYARVAALRSFIDNPTPEWAPAPRGTPRISGNFVPGGTVRCTGVSWRNDPETVQYRWRAGDQILDPTRSPSRVLPRSAAGREVACRVAAVNAGGLVRSGVSPARRVARR